MLGLIGAVGAVLVMTVVALTFSDRYGVRWGPWALVAGVVIYLALKPLRRRGIIAQS
jgi:hypothetical protein